MQGEGSEGLKGSWGLRFLGVWGLGFRVQGLRFRAFSQRSPDSEGQGAQSVGQ